MGEPTAFVLRLAAEYLKPVMPPTVLARLDAYFEHADRIIGDTLGRWTDKAMIIRQGPPLRPPPIREDVQEAVYTALLNNQRLEVAYRSKARTRPKVIELNLLGLVVRTGVVYLVATSWGYEDVRHYVLHRMSSPNLLDEPAVVPAGFRLADHVGHASAPSGTDLHCSRCHGPAVVDAVGFGSEVEVSAPETLRAEFRDQAGRLRIAHRGLSASQYAIFVALFARVVRECDG